MGGFELDGDFCRDIDACAGKGCGDNAQCTDKGPPAIGDEAGRNCECNAGFTMQANGDCVDINECNNNPCGSNSKCMDLSPPNFGFTCECNQGWELADTAASTGDCDQDVNACVNNPCALFEACSDKAAPSPDTSAGRACSDADACMAAPCQENADCTDVTGGSNDANGRTCDCVAGFRLAGVACWPDSIFPPDTAEQAQEKADDLSAAADDANDAADKARTAANSDSSNAEKQATAVQLEALAKQAQSRADGQQDAADAITTTFAPQMSAMEEPKTMSMVMLIILVILVLYGVGATYFMVKSKGTANNLAARQEQNASFTNPAYETAAAAQGRPAPQQQQQQSYGQQAQGTFTSNEGSYQDVGPSYAEPNTGGYMDVQGNQGGFNDDESDEEI